ncbi:MAG: ABC transporter substrate-binding protein [Burkholderiaceae bacterium]
MRRRQLSALIAAAGLAGHAAAPRAQPAGVAARRIGVLNFGTGPSGANPDPALEGFRQGLLDLGLIEGRNLVIDYAYAEGRPERLAGLVAELIALKPDVIVALGPGPLQAVRGATNTLAIVAIGGSDPVAEGWARSLARPGGNVTGLTVTFPELAPKYLEFLKQAVPGLTRVAVLFAPAEVKINPILEAGARELGLQMQPLEVSGPDDFEAAFDRASQGRAQGLYAIATNLPVLYRASLAELSLRHRLPSVGQFSLFAQAGFLLSYGADLGALSRRAATYVDKILKGARAGDLPIERPTEFELIVNRKTERALGMTLPPALLLRASRVIE